MGNHAAAAHKGFSLIELLISLAILALLLGFAGPSLADWIAARKLANHAEYLTETLNFARSEAVKRGMRVNLCKSRDRRQCDDSVTWDAGWIMFADDNRDGKVEAAESLIRAEGPARDQITISANHPVEDYVSYTTFGFARMLNGALQMGPLSCASPGKRRSRLSWRTAAAPASTALTKSVPDRTRVAAVACSRRHLLRRSNKRRERA